MPMLLLAPVATGTYDLVTFEVPEGNRVASQRLLEPGARLPEEFLLRRSSRETLNGDEHEEERIRGR